VNSIIATRQGIRLSQILPNSKIFGAEDIFVQSCCGHWQDCESNDIFVAIIGADDDGHDFAQEAIRRGATAIVTERLLSVDRPQCIVPDSRVAYGKICQALAGVPSHHLKTIGVSGSDGKTVTCHLIERVLRRAGKRSGLSSSIEVTMGSGRKGTPTSEMNSAMLADRLAQMAIAGCDHAVLEISSVSLAQRTLDGVTFDIAVLTNLRRSSLEFHGSLENYRRAQLRLLKHLKTKGVAILNADDPNTHFLLPQLKQPVFTIGIKQDAQLKAQVLERTANDQTFLISAGIETIVVCSKILGDHHIYNCLAATAVGLLLEIDLPSIGQALSDVQAIPGRLERVVCGQEFGVWIDSARTPHQLATALRSVQQSVRGRIWCVLGGHEQQTAEERKQIGEILERAADRVVLTSEQAFPAADYQAYHEFLDGCDQPGEVRLIPNRFRAIEWALSNAHPEDAVLICGCGDRPFAFVGDDRWGIRDRDVCESWLYDEVSLLPIEANPAPQGDTACTYRIDDYR
jgi:UDP-N-acetylmuramoyl-L-alanyl-D-glutamate--2,6-diaminopimelate ligase